MMDCTTKVPCECHVNSPLQIKAASVIGSFTARWGAQLSLKRHALGDHVGQRV